MDTAARGYLKELGAVMVAYGLALAVVVWVVTSWPDAPWRFAVAVLPIVPAAFIVVAFARLFARMDELQRRIQLEALGFAFAAGSLLTFTYGFLQVAGLPALSWLFVWPVYAVMWAVGAAVATRRWNPPGDDAA